MGFKLKLQHILLHVIKSVLNEETFFHMCALLL